MKVLNGFKRDVDEFVVLIKKNKSKITILLGAVCLVILVSAISKNEIGVMVSENQQLRNEIIKDKMKMQVMYQYILQQTDTITTYKTFLINCQREQIKKNQ